MQSSPASRHFVCLRSKYSQRPVLRHPQSVSTVKRCSILFESCQVVWEMKCADQLTWLSHYVLYVYAKQHTKFWWIGNVLFPFVYTVMNLLVR
jgi:hypothetical protein